jgi:hypothetical protein
VQRVLGEDRQRGDGEQQHKQAFHEMTSYSERSRLGESLMQSRSAATSQHQQR